jgi:putative resolvase
MSNFVKGKLASEILGVHQRTLYQWEEKGTIETIRTGGGIRLYNVDKYLANQKCKNEEDIEECIFDKNIDTSIEQLSICYCRVSSQSQKDDLERQKEFMQERYPNHILIYDIGSGLNLNKRGIKKIINLAIEGKVLELVIAYKDRLARFGYELIEDLIKDYSGGKITVVFKKEDVDIQTEIVQDLMAILNVFMANINSLRRYKKLTIGN